jgi:glyoxylase-like metal-dependent hydrolase (beta-lactamase superfamily II)
MINPEKLVQSMKRVFGDNAEKWYGEVMPVPERNLHPLKDGEEIDLGNGKILEIRHTPGHATHHLSVFDRSGGSLLAGEALGVYLPEVNVFFPSTPPPEFDLEQAVDSIGKLEGLPIERVLFSHFGSVAQSQQAVKTAKEMLIRWGRVIHHAMTETSQPDEILGKLSEEALHAVEHIRDNNALYEKYKALVEFRSRFTCGPGYIRYFNKGGAVL